MSDVSAPVRARALRWLKPDAHHIRSECGRFSVSRVMVQGALHYLAWNRTPPITELGSKRLPATATDAERQAAINEMRRLCEAAAANESTHTTKGDSHDIASEPETRASL